MSTSEKRYHAIEARPATEHPSINKEKLVIGDISIAALNRAFGSDGVELSNIEPDLTNVVSRTVHVGAQTTEGFPQYARDKFSEKTVFVPIYFGSELAHPMFYLILEEV